MAIHAGTQLGQQWQYMQGHSWGSNGNTCRDTVGAAMAIHAGTQLVVEPLSCMNWSTGHVLVVRTHRLSDRHVVATGPVCEPCKHDYRVAGDSYETINQRSTRGACRDGSVIVNCGAPAALLQPLPPPPQSMQTYSWPAWLLLCCVSPMSSAPHGCPHWTPCPLTSRRLYRCASQLCIQHTPSRNTASGAGHLRANWHTTVCQM
jgi:hypothetical protein